MMKIKLTGHLKRENTSNNTRDKRNKKNSKTSISDKNKFAIVEAYKSARTNIMFSLSASDKKSVAVTSYSKGEGKSTVAANLAISFSKMGKSVVLIDCDLRRPNLHNLLKVDNAEGLSDIIGHMTTLEDAIHKDVIPYLDVITSGTIPPNPSELLCAPEMTKLYEYLNSEYDYIIFDTPPMGVVSDTLLLKNFIAGYIYVVREHKTTHGDIEKLLNAIELADAKSLGFIRVGVSSEKKGKNYNYYQYY